MLKKLIDKILNRFFDYEIVGEYFESDFFGHLRKKYIKKYHLKKEVLKK